MLIYCNNFVVVTQITKKYKRPGFYLSVQLKLVRKYFETI